MQMVACPHGIFNLTQCLRFLFVFIVLDFRKKTKKKDFENPSIIS